MSISGISSNSNYLNELYKLLSGTQTASSSSSSGSRSNDDIFSLLTGADSTESDTGSADLGSLFQALESNNLLSAQNSFFAQLEQELTGAASTDSTTSSASSTSSDNSNPMKRDMDALGQALSSGDLANAQNIFATIMQHMQHQPPPPDANTSGNSASSVTSASNAAGSSNSLSDTLSALGKSLSSGDLTSAQSSFSDLLKSLQAVSESGSASAADTVSSYSNFNQKKLLDLLASLLSANTQSGTIATSA